MKRFLCLLAFAAIAMADLPEDLLIGGNAQLTNKMTQELYKNNPGKSIVLSAFSVLNPLAQLSLVTEGESHYELLRTIGLPNDEAITSSFPVVNNKLRDIKGVDLKMASRIYVKEGRQLSQTFNELSRNTFGSDVKQVNFIQNVAAANEINAWVEDNTNHRIKDLVDPNSLDSDTRAVLVNAIYFKGSWKEKFDQRYTREQDFYVNSTRTIKIPFMHKKADYKYFESQELDAKFLDMAFEGDSMSLLIGLPNNKDGLENLLTRMTPDRLDYVMNHMITTEVNVNIPKFKIETTTNLKDVLSNLGLKKIFDPSNANINKLIEGETGLYVSEAIQKAFIEINEEGGEAAAANEFVVVRKSAFLRIQENRFDATHPFLFLLKTGQNIIFNGSFRG